MRRRTVRALVEQGADLGAVDKFGRTAMHWAAYSGNLELVKYLVSVKADVNAADDGRTVLHAAAGRGELDVVEYLVGQGADPAVVDSDGNTPADIAADDGHGEVASYLSGLGNE